MLKLSSKALWIGLPIGVLLILGLSNCSGTPAQNPPTSASSVPQEIGQGSTPPAMATVPAPNEIAIATQENPLTPESNPVGDIPDSQVFVNYAASPGNYSLDVPEGWARTNIDADVRFVDKFDGLSVSITPSVSAPSVDSVRLNEIAALIEAGRAFQVGQITEMDLPGGHAVKITATVNSEPDPVTGKQVRLEEDIYIFHQNGTEAMLLLWAPQGADNVDQWKRISESFRWR